MRRGRSIKEEDRHAQHYLLEKLFCSRSAPFHIQGPESPLSISIPVPCYPSEAPGKTYCTTNNIARPALITGLLILTPEIWSTNIDGGAPPTSSGRPYQSPGISRDL